MWWVTFNYPPENPMSLLSPRSLRKLYQAVESRTIAIGVEEDHKPADKVPKQPSQHRVQRGIENPNQLRTKERMG